MSDPDRSQSRGREVYSSGRGGAGNIRQTSASRDARSTEGPDDFSIVRGREPHPAVLKSSDQRTFSTGRGGAGNIRSPSRDAAGIIQPGIAEEEDNAIIRAHLNAAQDIPHSSGRGGAGNISTSRSRSRGPVTSGANSIPPPLLSARSTGRGGAGNILGEPIVEVDKDEQERHTLHAQQGGIRSTGRGGSANMTSAPLPEIETPHHRLADYESHGRGGIGNIGGREA